jgi:F0F1-type ATP synthase assembly protein I
MIRRNILTQYKKKKKAQITSFIIFLVSIVVIAITFLIAKMIYSEIGKGITATDISTNTSTAAYGKFESSFTIFDYGMLLIVIGMTIGLIITSLFIPSHPVFMVINIIGLIFLVFIAAVLSNIYSDIAQTDSISSNMNNSDGSYTFTRTNFVIERLPWICVVVVALVTIIMYAKGAVGV